jgi:hypothetical protein
MGSSSLAVSPRVGGSMSIVSGICATSAGGAARA